MSLSQKNILSTPQNFGRWIVIAVGFAILAFFIMYSRWGGTISDSAAYFDTARYLRGEIPKSELLAPFPYRIVVPAIASIIPGDLRNGFATLNWLAMSMTALLISITVWRLGFGIKRAIIGGLLLLLAFPTYWYAPYLLVDPGSIFTRSAFVLAVVSGQPILAAVIGLIATGVREENILLLFWLIASRQISLRIGLLVLGAAATWLLTVRWWIIPDLPSYFWAPSFDRLIEAARDTKSHLSMLSAVGVVLPLAIYGWRIDFPKSKEIKSLLLLMALPALYATLCVRVDGRIIWGLYPMLIPFAAAVGRNRRSTIQQSFQSG